MMYRYTPIIVIALLWRLVLCSPVLGRYSLDGGKFKHIVVSNNGDIIVGGKNVVLQLASSNLSNLHHVDTSCPDATCHHRFPSANEASVFQAITVNGKEYLLFCGSQLDRPCFLYNSTDITQRWPILVKQKYRPGYKGEQFFGSYQSSSIVQYNYYPSRNLELYVAVPFSGSGLEDINSFYAFSLRVLEPPVDNAQFAETHYITRERLITNDSFIKAKPGHRSETVLGFRTDNYVYFLRNTVKNHAKTAFISRFCLDDSFFRSYIEAHLKCGVLTTLEEAVSVDTPGGTLLIASFTGTGGGGMCVYNMTKAEQFFAKEHAKCFRGKSGLTPPWIEGASKACVTDEYDKWRNITCGYTDSNTRILLELSLEEDIDLPGLAERYTAIAVDFHGPDAAVALYVGSAKGSIDKAVYSLDFRQATFVRNITRQPEGAPIENIKISKDNRKLIFLQANSVLSVNLDCQLYQECVSCLQQLDCIWTVSRNEQKCIDKGKWKLAVDVSRTFEDYCPPIISKISPTSGPLKGGTLLTLKGQFASGHDNRQANRTVWLDEIPCLNVDTSKLPSVIECFTPEVANAGRKHVRLTAYGASGERHVFSSPRLLGASFDITSMFDYVEPVLTQDSKIYVRESGGTQIKLHGKHLASGRNRTVRIGSKPCTITGHDILESSSLTCKTSGQEKGSYNVSMVIDGLVVHGPEVAYIPNPEVYLVDAHTIVSGGMVLTINGLFLEGFGLGLELSFLEAHTSANVANGGTCKVVHDSNSSRLECVTAEMKGAVADGFQGTFGIINVYGEAPSVAGNISVHSDPDIYHQPSLEYDFEYKLKGKGFGYFMKDSIKITFGSNLPCNVKDIMETEVTCEAIANGLEENNVSNHVPLDVLVSVGNRQYGKVGVVLFTTATPSTSSSRESPLKSTNLLLIAVVAAGLVVIGIGVLLIICRFRLKQKKLLRYTVEYRHDDNILTLESLSENNTANTSQGRQNAYQEQKLVIRPLTLDTDPLKDTEPLLPPVDDATLAVLQDKGLLISRDCLILGEEVGQGNFGCVFKAYLRRIDVKGELHVAAKTMNRNSPKELDVQMFLKEALIMKDFSHQNVMQLIGLCFGIEKLPLVILPFMTKGDLLSYIRDVNNEPKVRDLVLFSVDIANGMDYLSQLKFVHRDLAARNCMMDEEMVVKVADFGLSRDVYEKEYYSSCDKKTKLPVKWMSPESLEFGHYSHKSDVWSFGVVLWELLTRGMNPYPTVDNWDMMRYLKAGRRLNKPDFCPDEMYGIMQQCWNWDADERPTFSELTQVIPELLRKLEYRLNSKRRRLESRTSQRSDLSSDTGGHV